MTAIKLVLVLGLVFAPLGVAQRPGDVAPEFTLTDSSGAVVRMSDFQGEPVLLNFWATWCPPCADELPLFQEVADETPLTVLLVNMGEGQARAAAYLGANSLSLRTAVDGVGSAQLESVEGTLEVAQRYRVLGLPTSFFVGADGVVAGVSVGPLTPQLLAEQLRVIGVDWQP